MQDSFTVHCPNAENVTIVHENLKTHVPSSLYDALAPQDAHAFLHRGALHETPKHGRWLNRAEIACSALQRQCLDRRIPDQETLRAAIAAWEVRRNEEGIKVHWRFTTADARIRLKRLYPSMKN